MIIQTLTTLTVYLSGTVAFTLKKKCQDDRCRHKLQWSHSKLLNTSASYKYIISLWNRQILTCGHISPVFWFIEYNSGITFFFQLQHFLASETTITAANSHSASLSSGPLLATGHNDLPPPRQNCLSATDTLKKQHLKCKALFSYDLFCQEITFRSGFVWNNTWSSMRQECLFLFHLHKECSLESVGDKKAWLKLKYTADVLCRMSLLELDGGIYCTSEGAEGFWYRGQFGPRGSVKSVPRV